MFESVPKYQQWLEQNLNQQAAVAGSVHLVRDGALHLVAARNLPPPVLAAVAVVPEGKGMAGLAMQRKIPVSTCNLQTDESGDVRPGARAVQAQAAIAVPVLDGAQGVSAVVGYAWGDQRELDETLRQHLSRQAQDLMHLL
ncbi:hypothetical protein V8J88_00295 [Massilia sp. W12]|uniref:GAF domain-containing protein n=1 Tax=Massilia sp. W12 TaxID=3126507 RepID=UPI0030CB6B3F